MTSFLKRTAALFLYACAHRAAAPAAEAIQIAVTFDDLPRAGPEVPGTTRLQIHRELLAVLRRHRVPQVYGFVNGRAAQDPDGRAALEAWVAAGYPLGNHTWSHSKPTDLAAYLADVDANEPLLRELQPGPEARWKVYRYPTLSQGDTLQAHDAIRRHLAERGYRIAEVTIDFGDWAWNEPYARCLARGDATSVAELKRSFLQSAATFLAFDESFARRLFGRDIRHVLLLHAGALDAVLLEELLTTYERAGARWISFDEALEDPVFREDPRIAPTSGDILQEQVATARGTGLIPWVQMPLKSLETMCR